jgi:hypothetical protein
MLPAVVVHADWGTNPKKRVRANARLDPDGCYRIEKPQPVNRTGSWRDRLGIPATTAGPAMIGFDFPIGVPIAYADRAGITSFTDALVHFGNGVWREFYEVCRRPEEITLHRPFFPYSCPRKDMCRREQLTSALGIEWNRLYRQCERRTEDRRAACPLFWTLGGNQVGKGALAGWREFVQPMLSEGEDVGLWPFDGRLTDLLRSCSVVIVETYPTEFYGHLGVRFPGGEDGGKRSPSARTHLAETLITATASLDAELSAQARQTLASGFGSRGDGEDDFDALVGLLGMLRHVRTGAQVEAPPDPAVTSVEGWILGQRPPSSLETVRALST